MALRRRRPLQRRAVTGSTGPDAADRLQRVLDSVARETGSSPCAAKLGVMVVSPEGFGRREITNNEGHYVTIVDLGP